MNIIETGKVLAAVAAVDRRQVGESEIAAWHELLESVGLDDALDAVREHRRTSTDWIQPAHILRFVTRLKQKRIDVADATLEAFPNEVEGVSYLDELRALRRAIADGRMGAADLASYHASGRSIHLYETRGVLAGTRVVRGEIERGEVA